MTCRKGSLPNKGILGCGRQLTIWRHIDTEKFQARVEECAFFSFNEMRKSRQTLRILLRKRGRLGMELDHSRVSSTIWLEP